MAQAPRFRPGERFGDLVIERELGRGAFAVVYLAHDTLLDRPVALKVLAPTSISRAPAEREAFLAEARLAAKLQDPHIVTLHRVHDLGPSGFVLEMEYMPGGPLSARIPGGRGLPVAEVREHLAGLLRALATAHGHGVVHRDVKPDNLLLTAGGKVKLADFGLGRHAGEISLSGEHGGRILGTPLYMAPETVMGEPATAASDLWSVGVVLQQLLTGRLPFEAANLPALFYAIHSEDPAPLDRSYPPDLVRIVHRCLKKLPSERPPSATGLLTELEASAHPTPAAPRASAPPGPPPPIPKDLPLGREKEVERVEARLAASADGRGGALLVVGDAGVGKSALLRQARFAARARGARWIEAALTPLGGLQRPLLQAVRRMLLSETEEVRLADTMTVDRFGAAAPALRRLIDSQEPEVEGRQQLVWLLESLLAGLAEERPVVLTLEDLHFGDSEDLRVVGELVRRLAGARVAMFATYRSRDPGSSEGMHASASALGDLARVTGVESLELGPLAADAVLRVVEREAHGARLSPEVAQRVLDLAEGNPLFALELFHHLGATGATERVGDRIVPAGGWGGADLPRRLQDLVQLRLAALTEDQRMLLDAAAVDGVTFDGAALAAVLDLGLLKVLRDLQRIQREHGLVVAMRQGYRFAHALFRDAMVRDLAPDLRRTLHRALAEHLEAAGAASADAERLGSHWERAGDAVRAAPYLRRAALAAARSQQYHRALDLGRRAGVHASAPPPTTAEDATVAFALAGCLSDLGRTEEAVAWVRRIEAAARSREDGVSSLRAAVWLADLTRGSEGFARQDGALLERAASELDAHEEGGRALYLWAQHLLAVGDVEGARRGLVRAEELFRKRGPAHLHAQVVHLLAELAQRSGDTEGAIRSFELSTRLKEELGRSMDAAVSRIARAVTAMEAGRLEGVRADLLRAVGDLERSGAEDSAAHARVYVARLLTAEGLWREAQQTLEACLERLPASGSWFGRLEALLDLGHLLACLGELTESSRRLDEARALAEEGRDVDALACVAAYSAKHATLAGDLGAAWRHARAALPSAAASSSRVTRDEVALILAECHVLARAPEDVQRGAAALVAEAQGPQARAARRFLGPPSALADGVHRGLYGAEIELIAELARVSASADAPARAALRTRLVETGCLGLLRAFDRGGACSPS